MTFSLILREKEGKHSSSNQEKFAISDWQSSKCEIRLPVSYQLCKYQKMYQILARQQNMKYDDKVELK